MKIIGRKVLHDRSKTFVEPQIVPPSHSDEVTKPLVAQFMRNDFGNVLLITNTHRSGIGKQRDFTIRNETPVLHSPATKVRQGNMIAFR